jgi:hypothetical protein
MGSIVGTKIDQSSTGGTVTTVGKYKVHTFNTPGASTFIPGRPTKFIDILLVGGGGAGGPTGAGPSGGSAGGAGAVIYIKFVPVVAGTPYPINVGSGGLRSPGEPSFSVGNPGGTTTAFGNNAYGGGRGGANGNGAGDPSPFASGGGGGSYYIGGAGGDGGSGYGAIGYGFPGFKGGGPGPRNGGGGGGAGGGGPITTISTTGGPGVPITYFTGIPGDIAGVGGSVNASGTTSPFYGSGGSGYAGPGSGNVSGPPGQPGAAYIRYRDWSL